MRKIIKIVFILFFFSSLTQAQKNEDIFVYTSEDLSQATSPYIWPIENQSVWPVKGSQSFQNIEFTGRFSNYTKADTWYPSWASDGNLYSGWTDGTIGDMDFVWSALGEKALTGQAKIVGDDPMNLEVVNLGTHVSSALPYQGRYPCGSLHYNGVWYYGTYALHQPKKSINKDFGWYILGPTVGFRWSTDNGVSWNETPHTADDPLFDDPAFSEYDMEEGKSGPFVKLGAPHFVDFGQNMEHSPDGKAYLVGHGSSWPDKKPRVANNSWNSGDEIYLSRVTPSIENMNDGSEYEFFSGFDEQGNEVWTNTYSDSEPIFQWNNKCGIVCMTYNAPLEKYIMCITHAHKDSASRGSYDTYLMESDKMTGPWKMVTYMREFGRQAYFVNIPSKFISENGLSMWLCYSANYMFNDDRNNPDFLEGESPKGSAYSLSLHEIKLLEERTGLNVNVRAYGALGDSTDATQNIQQAIDEVSRHGGGEVGLSPGTYVCSTLFLKSNVLLHLEEGATILGSPEHESYTETGPVYETFFLREDRYPGRVLIVGIDIENAGITGAGVIDGNGQHPNLKVARLDAVNTIRFIRCRNMRIEGLGGRLTIRNSSHWTVQPIGVDSLIIRNVFISNFGGNTPDGLAISDCRNVLVENVEVEADDDAITLKSGTPEITMENIVIKNCIGRSRVCGFKTGPQTWGTIRNVQITNCHFQAATIPPATQYALQNGVFLNVSNGGSLENIVVKDCTIDGFPSAFSIVISKLSAEYWKSYWPGAAMPEEYGSIRNITFENIDGKNLGNFGVLIEGRKSSPIKDVQLKKVHLSTEGGGSRVKSFPEKPNEYPNIVAVYKLLPAYGMYLRHVEDMEMEDVEVIVGKKDKRSYIVNEDFSTVEK